MCNFIPVKMRRTNEENIGTVLKRLVKDYQLEGRLTRIDVYPVWEQLMGFEVAGQTEQIKIRNGVMTVYLKSSALRNDLVFSKEHILMQLKNLLPDAHLNSLQFA